MESCESPDPIEVTNFHYCQLRTLRLAKGNEKVPKDCINVVASASKYGLLFIGIECGFKVLRLENILDLSEDKENKSMEENYHSQVVSTETPVLLSLSADQKTLAVCVNRNGSFICDIYDIAAFSDSQSTPIPFQNVLLCGNGVKLKDFAWNPVAAETYSFCTSDGSLSVHELTGTTLKIVANVQNASASCVCWSPKGKQIVVGKTDGSFSQYKPTLQEVKNMPSPPLEEKVTVESICWVSTTQFVILYVPITKGSPPYLFVVSTPKGSPMVYLNFYDVCLGNSSSDDQRYFLHSEPTWGVVVCASTDSIEIATIGNCPNWVQWDVKEDGKALLPGKDGASHAIGMGVMYCAQRKIVISEYESYPPMPILFLLTNNGLLVPFHMINSTPGLENLVHPIESFDKANERKRPGGLPKTSQRETVQPSISSSSGFQQPSAFQPQPMQEKKPSAFASTPPFSVKQSFNQIKNDQVFSGVKPNSPSNMPSAILPAHPTPIAKPAFATPDVGRQNALSSNTGFASTPDNTLKSRLQEAPAVIASKRDTSKDNTYIAAIVEEVQTFEKELEDLKLSFNSFASIGTKEEMSTLKSATMNAEDFHKAMSETMTSLYTDIHDLKNVLLESFVMVEDANSRERRKNDNLFISLLRERALDPVTAKQLKQIEQHYMYLSTQLQEVGNKIDQDWVEHLEKKKTKQRSVSHLSSVEAIYKTLVNNQNSIHNLRKNIENVSEKATEKRLENISRRQNRNPFMKRTTQEELSKLADTFLQTKISNDEEKKPKFKKLPPEAQEALKNYLSSSKVNTVRPTVVYSPSQSRFISKSVLFSENMKKNEMQANKAIEKQASPATPSVTKEKLNQLNSTFIADKPQEPRKSELVSKFTLPPTQSPTPEERYSPSVSSSGGPYYEDITPPGSPCYPATNTLQFIQELIGQGNYDEEKIQMLLNAAIRFKNENFNREIASNAFAEEFVDTENYSAEEQYSGSNSSSQSNVSIQPPSVASALNTSYGIPTAGVQKSPLDMQKSNFPTFTANENKPDSSFSFLQPLGAKTSDIIGTSKQSNSATHQQAASNIQVVSSLGNWSNNQLKTSVVSHEVPPNQTITSSTPFVPAPNRTVLFTPQSNKADSKKIELKSFDTENRPVQIDRSPLVVPPPATVASNSFTFKSNQTPVKSQAGTFFSGNLQNMLATPQSTANSSSTATATPSSIFAVPSEPKSSESAFSFSLKPSDTEPNSSFTFGKTSFSSKISTVSTPPSLTFSQVTTSVPVSLSSKSDSLTESSDSKSVFAAAGDSLFGQVLASETKKDSPSILFVPTSTAEPETKVIELSLSDLSKSTNVDKPTAETVQVTATTTVGATVQTSPSVVQPTIVSFSSVTSENSTSSINLTTNSITSGTALQASESKENVSSVGTSNVVAPSLFTSTAIPSSTSSDSSTNPPANSAPPLFGQTNNGASLFTSPTTTQSFFGVTNTSVFGKPAAETTTTKSSFFGNVSVETSSAPSFFGKAADTPAFGQAALSQGSVFGSTTATTKPSLFGSNSTTTQGSVFGSTANTTQGSVFGSTVTTTQSSVFGSAATTTQGSVFGSTASTGSFFGGAPVFGANATNSSESTGFGNQSGGSFSFGTSPFGQTQGTFGLAKSVFGQSSTFGQPATQQASSGFGQSSGVSGFGQGSFSFGLGGKPSEENASKNVFAMGNLGKPPSETSGVFGSSGASAFGAKTNAFSPGSFSSGGGSVAQSGFGAFQQNSQKTGGFGSSPAFGGGPSFGSAPAFGSPPSFGSGNALASVFGASQQQSPTFSSFASANSPTFGALASQTPTFGSPQQQQGFGSAPVFGGGSAFGGQAPSFGSPSGGQSGSSAFTQWRN